jgi:hypothetical protein
MATNATVAAESSPTTRETSSFTAQHENHLPMDNVRQMIDACSRNDLPTVQQFLQQDVMFARQQDFETGLSPLMTASQAGHKALVLNSEIYAG